MEETFFSKEYFNSKLEAKRKKCAVSREEISCPENLTTFFQLSSTLITSLVSSFFRINVHLKKFFSLFLEA